MELLCLTDADPAERLAGLALLPHVLRASPLAVQLSPTAAARFDLVLVDATLDMRQARMRCLELGEADTPRVLICHEAGLAAVSAEWQLADVMVPGASPAEIELRLRLATTRRSADAQPEIRAETVKISGLEIDDRNFTARVHERRLDLTYKEFELLHFLASNPGRVFTREQLLSEVWGSDYYGGTRTVDVHVRRLRAKLGDHEALIGTVRGVGYGFARERDTPSPAAVDESETE